jgi:hypothetical protein
MADATVTLGLDAAQLRTGLKKASAEVDGFTSRTQQSMSRLQAKTSKGVAGQRAGGVAMQVQDIAVQAQMGTSALTILAQQGSQVASIFGPKGAIIGGLIALGAVLFSVGFKAKSNFTTFTEEANKASEALGELSYSGDVDALSRGMSGAREEVARLGAELENVNSRAGYAAIRLGQLFGGPSAEAKAGAMQSQLERLGKIQSELGQTAIQVAAKELEITQLRVQGKADEADEIQRQLDLYKEIERIRSSSFDAATKRQLIENATALSNAAKALKDADDAKKETEKQKKEDSKKTGADTNEDGFISKREQRVFDLAQERGQRKADSIKGFSRKARGLSAFGGLAELEEMNAMQEMHGFSSVGLRFKGVRSTDPLGTVAARNTPDGKGGTDRMVTSVDKLYNLIEQRLTVD